MEKHKHIHLQAHDDVTTRCRSYEQCIEWDLQPPWCSLTKNFDVDGKRGDCLAHAVKPPQAGNALPPPPPPDAHTQCVTVGTSFPFVVPLSEFCCARNQLSRFCTPARACLLLVHPPLVTPRPHALLSSLLHVRNFCWLATACLHVPISSLLMPTLILWFFSLCRAEHGTAGRCGADLYGIPQHGHRGYCLRKVRLPVCVVYNTTRHMQWRGAGTNIHLWYMCVWMGVCPLQWEGGGAYVCLRELWVCCCVTFVHCALVHLFAHRCVRACVSLVCYLLLYILLCCVLFVKMCKGILMGVVDGQ